jgi:FAD/FMN-containing dehydrogenase
MANPRPFVGRSASSLPTSVVSSLTQSFRGTILDRGGAAYEEARTVWNAMIDRRPGMIVRPFNAADVAAAVRFAAQQELFIAVKGGGHNIAGLATCDDGLLIDLSQMKGVEVDPVTRTAAVEPGVTLGELDKATQAFGLAVPVGINSTTGIAGLTLGGGFGWTSRAFGLTVDNLMWAEVVLADGTQVRTSETQEPDLFWALRGGGGNFGIVTRFGFRLHPVGPTILAGLVVHPFDDATGVLNHMRDCAADAPDQLSTWAVLRKAPPLPFLPAEWHGREVVVLAMAHVGEASDAERAAARVRKFGRPIADVVAPTPFVGWQTAFDPLLTPGARNYWKTHNFATLNDGLRDTLIDHTSRLPGDETEVFLGHLGGAVRRVSDDATAYGARDGEFVVNVHGRWRSAGEDERFIGWARGLFNALTPYATGSAYLNFLTADESARVGAAYGKNFERLGRIKGKYDAGNLFRGNQNIEPVV